MGSFKRHTVVFFLNYLRPHVFKEVVLLVLLILSTASTLVFPYITKLIIDDVFPNKDCVLLIALLIVLVGVSAGGFALNFAIDYLYTWVANRVILDMRRDLFGRLMKVPIGFYDQNKPGEVVYRIGSEITTIQNIITSSVLRLVNHVVLLTGLVIVLCWLNPYLFVLTMLTLPFVGANTYYFKPKIKGVAERLRNQQSDLMSFLFERFEKVKLVQSFNSYTYEMDHLLAMLQGLMGLNLKNVTLASAMNAISGLLMLVGPVLVFAWGGNQVMQGAMTVGALIAFLQYFSKVFNPLKDLNKLYTQFVRASVSMERVMEYMREPTYDDLFGTDNTPFSFRDRIVFRNVSFGYNGTPVLRGVNLEILKGKTYALVGASGCGKSTLINLLSRFYHPQSGKIYIDNLDLGKMDLYDLRDHIGFVSQEGLILRDSLWENIKYGNFGSTLDEVQSASQMLGLDLNKDLLEQNVTDGVGNQEAGGASNQAYQLSGGQKQRIAIARIILKAFDIIVLDEATSALDSESEHVILEKVRSLYPQATLILISHRVSTVKQADTIFCLDQGRIVDVGDHEALLEKQGFYWQLFRNQIVS